jgi:hypothetical protein
MFFLLLGREVEKKIQSLDKSTSHRQGARTARLSTEMRKVLYRLYRHKEVKWISPAAQSLTVTVGR